MVITLSMLHHSPGLLSNHGWNNELVIRNQRIVFPFLINHFRSSDTTRYEGCVQVGEQRAGMTGEGWEQGGHNL